MKKWMLVLLLSLMISAQGCGVNQIAIGLSVGAGVIAYVKTQDHRAQESPEQEQQGERQ